MGVLIRRFGYGPRMTSGRSEREDVPQEPLHELGAADPFGLLAEARN